MACPRLAAPMRFVDLRARERGERWHLQRLTWANQVGILADDDPVCVEQERPEEHVAVRRQGNLRERLTRHDHMDGRKACSLRGGGVLYLIGERRQWRENSFELEKHGIGHAAHCCPFEEGGLWDESVLEKGHGPVGRRASDTGVQSLQFTETFDNLAVTIHEHDATSSCIPRCRERVAGTLWKGRVAPFDTEQGDAIPIRRDGAFHVGERLWIRQQPETGA